jgi:hypothetical protein
MQPNQSLSRIILNRAGCLDDRQIVSNLPMKTRDPKKTFEPMDTKRSFRSVTEARERGKTKGITKTVEENMNSTRLEDYRMIYPRTATIPTVTQSNRLLVALRERNLKLQRLSRQKAQSQQWTNGLTKFFSNLWSVLTRREEMVRAV